MICGFSNYVIMKKTLIISILLICIISISVFASDRDNGINKIEYNETTIVIDLPASLDAYVICYDKSNDEIWHTKLYSYDFIKEVTMEAQRVTIHSIEIDNEMIKIIDSRKVIYYLDPSDGKIIETDNSNYTLPDFSDISTAVSGSDNNGFIKYIAIFAAFIGVGLIVFVASRNKK